MSTLQHVTLDDGQKMPVRVVGQGKPVVLLHGFGMNADTWLPFVLPYTRSFKFYLPHLRGFGRAWHNRINGHATLYDAYRADFKSLRKHYGLDQLILGGYSMGAGLSLSLFQRDMAEGVQKYLHMDLGPGFMPNEEWPDMIFADHNDRLLSETHSLFDQVKNVRGKNFNELDPQLQETIFTQFRRFIPLCFVYPWQKNLVENVAAKPNLMKRLPVIQNWEMMVNILDTILNEPLNFNEIAPKMTMPVTSLYGAKSEIFSEQTQRRMVEMLPQGKAVALPKAGHLLMADQPILFTRELGKFLKE